MNKKVLLIEDHDNLRYIIGAFLSKKFEVVGARNGLEAMGWLSKGVLPDVIISDARMPELDGASFLSNLRCSGLFSKIPVVIISGADSHEEEQQFQQLGISGYFRKPFNPVQLQDQLIRIVG
ncbi:MAG: response regulator [Bacteroidetes bacterium]|jgi:CheY-like chemotaxis protein|nr:response regulator [Bacteroidota bacterium]